MNTESVYSDLGDRPTFADRPWVAINMVSTIDGKILTGDRDENVMDLGSKTDHATMRFIELAHDAVMIGAGSLRATVGLWYPKNLRRFVVSLSGNLDYNSRFFQDSLDRAVVICGSSSPVPAEIQKLVVQDPIDWKSVLSRMKKEFQVDTLLVEGGSELNASLLRADLVDELFLTIAPKIRLGSDIPTIADGKAFSRAEITNFKLVSCTPIADEVFLRYRRR